MHAHAVDKSATAAAILPVKRFDAAKQRLKDALGAGSRSALAAAMFADVLSALDRSSSVDAIFVVSAESEVKDLTAARQAVLIPDVVEKGQSRAALSGLARAAALGYGRALLVPGDCPLLDPAEVDQLIGAVTASTIDVAIVPDRHEHGTNALVVDPSGPFEPQFGPDSLRRHVEQATRRGLRNAVQRVPSLALDIDSPEDLGELTAALDHSRGRAPRTEGVLRQIQRSRQHPPVAA
jgi:2-phospho-L-lactate/phosphoenolpyruvate guanylyltransferase